MASLKTFFSTSYHCGFVLYLDNIVGTDYVASFAKDKKSFSSATFLTSFDSSVKDETFICNKNNIKYEINENNSLLCAVETTNEETDIIDQIEVI